MCLCMCVCERDKCHLRLRTFFYRGKADVYNIHKDFIYVMSTFVIGSSALDYIKCIYCL